MKRVAHLGVGGLAVLMIVEAALSAPIVYGIRYDRVVRIDAATGSSTQVGNALGLYGFDFTTPSAFDPVSRTPYLACKKSGDSVNYWWWKIDVTTGAATTSTLPIPSASVAYQYFFDPTDDRMYSLRNGTVAQVNLDTGRTKEGHTYTLEVYGPNIPSAYDPLDNTLYVAATDSYDGLLYWWQIDTATGDASKTLLSGFSANGLEYDIGRRTIFAVQNDRLVKIGMANGLSKTHLETVLNVAALAGSGRTTFDPCVGQYYISGPRSPTYMPTWWNVDIDPPGAAVHPAADTYALHSDYYRAPLALIQKTQTIEFGGELILDIGKSNAIDVGTVNYAWDLDDDGEFETDAGNEPTFSLPFADLLDLGLRSGHTYTIHLQVTDAFGEVATDWATLTIVPEPTTLGLLIAGAVALPIVRRRRACS